MTTNVRHATAPTTASRRERLYGWLAGKLIVRAARLALRRGDRHEFDHLHAAIAVGNTGKASHGSGCPLVTFPTMLASKETTR